MAGKPIKVAFISDTGDLRRDLNRAEQALEDVAEEAEKSSTRIADSLDRTGEVADEVASGASQLAGGIGDVTGALEATGLISEGTVEQLETVEKAIMGITGVSDLANLAFEKLRLGHLAQAAASKVSAAATWVLNAAMSANPVMLVVIAVAALVAGIVLLAKRNEWVAEKLGAAWDWIKDKAAATWDWIKDKAGALVDWFGDMPGRLSRKVSGLWDGFKSGFKSMLNAIIGWWNDLSFSFDVPDWIPGIPDKITLDTPNIPMLAKGGIVTRPTLAVVGEAGPEAVVPLNGRHFGGGGVTIGELHVHAPVGASAVDIGRELVAYLDAYAAAGGRSVAVGG